MSNSLVSLGEDADGFEQEFILAAAPPVAEPHLDWNTGTGVEEQSAIMERRRRLWGELRQPIVVTWLEGLKLRLIPDNETSRVIFLTGRFEPNEFWWLKTFLRPGMTVIDAGANLGTYTLFCAKLVGPDGHVVSVEPSERDYDWLLRNVRLNRFENVHCEQAALSDRSGRARLKVASNWHSGHNTLGNYGFAETEHLRDEEVDLKTLDQLAKDRELSRVDFIKMDIEGAEFLALRGASAILDKHRPIILVEVSERTLRHQNASAAKLLDFLMDNRYRIFRFDAERRRLVSVASDAPRPPNLFAVPIERITDAEI